MNRSFGAMLDRSLALAPLMRRPQEAALLVPTRRADGDLGERFEIDAVVGVDGAEVVGQHRGDELQVKDRWSGDRAAAGEFHPAGDDVHRSGQ